VISPVVEIETLTRRFGTFTAVDSLTLVANAGEVFGLLGSNGAGKSTTIKMLTTLLPPSSGEARVGGFSITTQPVEVGYRLGRTAAGEMAGWLRALRQMLEIPVDEFAQRLGVSRREIFRLEKSEEESRIQLGTLRRAAEALDCELIYALTPRQGTLGEMAAVRGAAREAARKQAQADADERRVAEGKPRKGRDPQLAAIKMLLRMAGIKC
jgi:ABC-2 type transport system ATP-binding protein